MLTVLLHTVQAAERPPDRSFDAVMSVSPSYTEGCFSNRLQDPGETRAVCCSREARLELWLVTLEKVPPNSWRQLQGALK